MNRAISALRRKGARRVLLFGSFADDPERARDVDLAVEGIPLTALVEAEVAVADILNVPTDMVSREENPEFFRIVAKRGKTLYQEGKAG